MSKPKIACPVCGKATVPTASGRPHAHDSRQEVAALDGRRMWRAMRCPGSMVPA